MPLVSQAFKARLQPVFDTGRMRQAVQQVALECARQIRQEEREERQARDRRRQNLVNAVRPFQYDDA